MSDDDDSLLYKLFVRLLWAALAGGAAFFALTQLNTELPPMAVYGGTGFAAALGARFGPDFIHIVTSL